MPDEPEIRFESALAELETLVDALQRGEPELDSALAKYRKGVELLGRCYGLLERAERSVAVLTGLDESGEPVTSPFDPTATIDLARSAAAVAVATSEPEPEVEPETDPEPPAPKPRRKRAARAEEPPAPAPPAAEYDRFDPPF
ncbi:exodeoxyribonuclease VII small subunit [Paludisphaera sp.]|uniref:exodeoxyribonuclease VII small subunit n=1 Tax=Paludisphaera sp. TaxID=2017432 RepID=UPI00301CC73D